MQCAAAATIALEKWVELTSDPDLKEELELLLEKISVLNVVASGGVTAAEYDLAVESVEVNPFAGVPDSGQDPLDVRRPPDGVPRSERQCAGSKGEERTHRTGHDARSDVHEGVLNDTPRVGPPYDRRRFTPA